MYKTQTGGDPRADFPPLENYQKTATEPQIFQSYSQTVPIFFFKTYLFIAIRTTSSTASKPSRASWGWRICPKRDWWTVCESMMCSSRALGRQVIDRRLVASFFFVFETHWTSHQEAIRCGGFNWVFEVFVLSIVLKWFVLFDSGFLNIWFWRCSYWSFLSCSWRVVCFKGVCQAVWGVVEAFGWLKIECTSLSNFVALFLLDALSGSMWKRRFHMFLSHWASVFRSGDISRSYGALFVEDLLGFVHSNWQATNKTGLQEGQTQEDHRKPQQNQHFANN